MPIIDDKYIYEMPQNVKEKITKDFLKVFMNELYSMGLLSLGDFYIDSLVYSESTSGWDTAFGVACVKTNNKELREYADNLPWYEYDLFCEDVGDLILKNKLILKGDLDDVIYKQTGLKVGDDYGCCLACGKRFPKSLMTVSDGYNVCLECNGEHNPHKYYLEGLELLRHNG